MRGEKKVDCARVAVIRVEREAFKLEVELKKAKRGVHPFILP